MNIFVGNLPESISAAQLQRMFSRYGTVVNAVVAMEPKTGRPRRHGNVFLVPNRAARTAILELDLIHLGGRQITVRECARREPHERRASTAASWSGFERRKRHRERRHPTAPDRRGGERSG